MQKVLDENVLRPGDIALTTTSAKISRLIRAATLSRVSHAMMCVTHSSIIHADREGVHAENMQRITFPPATGIYVMRLRGDLPEKEATNICDYVRTIVGPEYSVKEAIRVASGGGKLISPKQFCSRLVAQAYDRFSIKLVSNPDFCTPEQLRRSTLLEEVPNATKMISDEQAAAMQQGVHSPDLIRNTTNEIFGAIRQIDPSIQNFTDIGKFVIEHPECDDFVNDLFVESGYTEIWRVDYEGEYEWRQSIDQMQGMARQAGIREYCESTLKAEPRDSNRFTKTRDALVADNANTPRKTFRTLIDLYSILVNLHQKRFDVAQQWLRQNPK